jgi:type II secretory pathway pseudopilin PulG
MLRSSKTHRGYTIVELLSVVFVMGLIMSAIALIIGPLLRSQDQTQAKVDTVQAAAMAVYRVERDLRNSSVGSIYACTTSSAPTCTAVTTLTSLTPTSALVIPTANSGGTGQFQLSGASTPEWQGATVYWVDSVGNLDVAFDYPTTSGFALGDTLTPGDAAQAVTDVMTAGGMQLARFVQQMSVASPALSQMVSFQLQAHSTVGNASNETTYQTDVEIRNN